jgi:hypothetical protein
VNARILRCARLTKTAPIYRHLIFIVDIQTSKRLGAQGGQNLNRWTEKTCLPYVYVMSTHATLLDALLRRTNSTTIYDHGDGEVSTVNIKPARLGVGSFTYSTYAQKCPLIPYAVPWVRFRTVQAINEKKWPKDFRYQVNNGIRLVFLPIVKTPVIPPIH